MANEKRLRTLGAAGTLDTAAITSGSTTINSAGLADLGVVDSTNHAALTFYTQDATTGRVTSKEILYVTAHTAAATSATVTRGNESTTAAAWAIGDRWVHSLTPKDFDGSGGGSGLIGLTTYNPGSATGTATTSTSYTDVDATNLAVAFTVPPSGAVLLRLTARALIGTANNELSWNIREASSDLSGTNGSVVYSGLTTFSARCTHAAKVSGLTAGASKTYKWGHARTFGSGTVETHYGLTDGQAVMEVWAVNL